MDAGKCCCAFCAEKIMTVAGCCMATCNMGGSLDCQWSGKIVACLLQVTGRSGALLGTFGAFGRNAIKS